jgi:hypothetical protein
LKGTLNRDSLNLGGIGYRTEKTGIRIGYTWIGTKKKWNKNMAKKIVTTIDRALGQQNGSEVYNLNLGWLTLKPHMFLLSLPIKNNKIVFGVKELGATCHKHHPATKSHA